jgi:enoyl-CoA hydratase/carnithine racemase
VYSEVLFEVVDGVGKATLNRPQLLNALNIDMILALTDKLGEWSQDRSIRAVMLFGAGDKAFCAGGDVRALADAKTRGDTKSVRDFFWHEYRTA